MKNTEETRKISVDDLEVVYTGAPKTHVFYEYQGERAVDPLQLVKDGEVLWLEQAKDNLEHGTEVLLLWNEAKDLLSRRHDTLTHSYVEHLRHQITMGAMDPRKWWRKKKPYPYRGMLVSAIYFQEALRLCEEGNADRVWHIIAMAYYHLGINTTPSSTQAAAKAAKKKHEEATEIRRALVLVTLEIMEEEQKKKRTISNIDEAKDKVIQLIYSNEKAMAELEYVDALTSDNLKQDKMSDALDRFRSLLDKWAAPSSPHPDIARAFSSFGQKQLTPEMVDAGPGVLGTELEPDITHYMRLVNFFEDGHKLTLEIIRRKCETPGS